MSTKTKDDQPKLMDYEQAKKLARHGNPVVRRELAARDDVRSEFLYYLSEDPSPEVRRADAKKDDRGKPSSTKTEPGA